MVRTWGRARYDSLIELNLERDPAIAACFADNHPAATIRRLEAFARMPISTDGRTLLFLDEIQAEPTVVAKLRWFAEELPGLPVIAAGSLLDFALREPTFSMPDTLLRWFHQELTVANIASGVTVLDPLHARLQELFICYLLVGGMPAAVSRFCKGRSFLAAAEIHADLLAVLRSDFAKYAARVHQGRLNTVFASVAAQLGGKFGYQACRSRRSCRCN